MKISHKEFKLYLEGQKVPFTSAQLMETGYSPPSCIISVPASSKILDLLPGTIATLFLKEKNKSFIIFEGELMTKSFSKNGASRTATLSFSSLSNSFNRVFKTPVATANPSIFHGANSVVSNAANEKDTAIKYGSLELQSSVLKLFNLGVTIKKFITGLRSYIEKNNNEIFKEAIQTIFEDFTKTSNWYKYIFNAFKFKERILVFPNKKIIFTLTKGVSNILLTNRVAPLGNLATMTQILYRIINYFGHTMIHLPAPSTGPDKKGSWVFMPANSYLCPIKQNIFFGSSVQSATFSSGALTEPTRLSLWTSSLELILSNGGDSFRPTFFAPGIDYIDKETSQIDYTRDEQYIGPIPSQTKLEGVAEAWANIDEQKSRDSGKPASQKDVEENKKLADQDGIGFIVGEAAANIYIKRITMKKFWDNKYKSRQFNITAPYSPNRIVGFAGIFVDELLPNIVGMVSSISTSISADGLATSNITITRAIRTWEWDSSGIGFDDTDIIPDLAPWFDSDIYSIDNIGLNVYNILNGIDSKNDLSSLNSLENLKIFKKIKNEIVSNKIKSILNDKKNSKYMTTKIALLSEALQKHHSSLTEDKKLVFEEAITKRNLLEESDYWEFLLGDFIKRDSEAPAYPENYKETDIYRDIEQDSGEDYISIQKDEHENYKPFIKTRLEAVRRIL